MNVYCWSREAETIQENNKMKKPCMEKRSSLNFVVPLRMRVNCAAEKKKL